MQRYSRVLGMALALLTTGVRAQSVQAPRPANWCGTTAEQERYFAEHPGAHEAQQAFYRRLEAASQAQLRTAAGPTATPDVTIPVVVHVIHAGGTDNISDAQVQSAIDQLNLDYQKLNPDTASIIPLFRPIAASVGFQFRLAKKDPNGNCTTGITRHYLPNLTNDPQNGSVQAVGVWDQSKYLNIWVVNSIGVATAGGFTVGYVSPPNQPTNPRDGFVVRNDYFGNQGTSNPSRALLRGATHEIGHYFGLAHPWGSTNDPGTGNCTGTDNVADTPPTDGTFNCNLSYAPCGPIANVQNYMDYASCAVMFTQGQRALMRAVLAANRSVLVSAANLAATGTNDGFVAPSCAPIAAFGPAPGSGTSVCVNTPVVLRDYSSNFTTAGGAVTYTWAMPGGTPNRGSGPTVTVTYPTAGIYTVTETVSNAVGSSTATSFIKVEGPTGGETAPFAESFEDPNFPVLFPSPSLRNYETSGTTSAGATSASFVWRRQTLATPADGTAYLVVTNRTYPAGTTTTLITPNINLAGVPGNATLSFARAYALRTVTDDSQLRVSFSSDCGATWTVPTVFDAAALNTQGRGPVDGFVPAAATDWQTLSVPVPAQFQGGGVKVRFQMVNGTSAGNNFFFDYLRVSGPLSTRADALASRGIGVFPNPLTSETAVHFNLAAATDVQVRLTDVLGRDVLTLPAKTYGAGQHALALTPAGHALRAGVYVVRITLNGELYTSKLTVE
ncbi:M43 family zinc metalloprotease [Hymenobacter armeniacus]|uniref:PKD domain-containing protein n=1 Tax=Hymenobacter armeniacus TaxID=2771358 RepID=A0ABR8JML2_9BACT|nr:M43 family zinc metalloprotease [Hymenobacter armeniacus]MBD2721245.1 PKD domain-containing protein [Hymenobacter armeniacus]